MPLKSFLFEKRKLGLQIGLVPTMGALHQGHISLIKKCTAECDLTVVSIFVNPTQFNNVEDFEKYPMTVEDDKSLLIKEQVDVLFIPDVEEIYPKEGKISLNFGSVESVMEGKFRPGHFSGVGLIVSKLFNIVSPDVAFFGQKDLQQTAIIKKLNEELTFGIDIRIVPTVRNNEGLALSSRNKRLNNRQKVLAPLLYKLLTDVRDKVLDEGNISLAKDWGRKQMSEFEPEIELEYLEIVDSDELTDVENISNHKEISLCIAAYLGEIRLIDNLFLFSR